MTDSENKKIILGRHYDSFYELSVFAVAITNSIKGNVIRSYVGLQTDIAAVF